MINNIKNIKKINKLNSPKTLKNKLKLNKNIKKKILKYKKSLKNILKGKDDRVIVIIGPCSIHDTISTMEYAKKLAIERKKLIKNLEIVMRVYFEKPRTTIGWKGLINDPYMDNTFKINDGLQIARKLLLNINKLNLPSATEFLDLIIPQYIKDLISFGTIGARTSESQIHREMASGLNCPIGFKNNTDGNIKIAIDAIKTAKQKHHFLSVNKFGKLFFAKTNGNKNCHLILRGGKKPNYDSKNVKKTYKKMSKNNIKGKIIIDASHDNSSKNYKKQILVCLNIAKQIAEGNKKIGGIMIESHLFSDRQDMTPGGNLIYGKSITDSCISFKDSLYILNKISKSVDIKRKLKK